MMAVSAARAKRTARTIVAINRVFSKPRRVWKEALKFWLAPRAPPKLADERWRSIAVMRIAEAIICM